VPEATPTPSADATEPRPRYGRIDKRYDPLKQTTDLVLAEMELSTGQQVLTLTMVSILRHDDGRQASGAVALFLEVRGTTWSYLTCPAVDLVVDDVPLAVTAKHEGEVQDGETKETVSVLLSRDDVERLSIATVVEGRVCKDEFVLAGPRLERIQAFAREVTGQAVEDANTSTELPPPVRAARRPVPAATPTPTPRPSHPPTYSAPVRRGPVCAKGCPCGNSCIDCRKRCRK
jgi:hypothetical protein